jgi:hypothetical protein
MLILANVAAFMAGTTSKVASSGANIQPTGGLWVFEAVSVALFTVEVLLGFVAAGQDPRHAGVMGRIKYARCSVFNRFFTQEFAVGVHTVAGLKPDHAHALAACLSGNHFRAVSTLILTAQC